MHACTRARVECELTSHRQTKYAANVWVHLRDYVTPNLWGCTGSFS